MSEELRARLARETRLLEMAVEVNRWAGWCRAVGYTSGIWSLIGIYECVSSLSCDPWPFRAQVAFHCVLFLGIAPIASVVITKAQRARKRYDAAAKEGA